MKQKLLFLMMVSFANTRLVSAWMSRQSARQRQNAACLLCLAATTGVSFRNTTTSRCAPEIPEEWLEYDHYNGVTILFNQSMTDFGTALQNSLQQWKQEGRKGIWLHVPAAHADHVGSAVAAGFRFHLVQQNTLILSAWLPSFDDPSAISRLPAGPTHQVGVGCLVFHPDDSSQMLVVQEKTGPAAAWSLWKMPTGLTDAGEDIHAAAERELKEETGLTSVCRGILQFRQAHPTQLTTLSRDSKRVYRTHSDLFFVCVLQLLDAEIVFEACPDEIAAIQWMSVEDYCRQERWQSSPVYQEMNRVIQEAQTSHMMQPYTLELGFGRGTNALYHSRPPKSQL
ncbi:hypothetical protein FisN_19Lh255 [Fistulifera solaris]|uniref:Nudix hydrolase domain-containing protein n=1 Tax=Fistulifera solaris TaxID=1519565 RepID=A0A1Z5K7C8_FISSO|nr:hypothetical protein FisN_19Lh255 [Fistulifera solaris]|eukprot:GAX22193.1 hypothetical protein FisN_19Lh255 [Fistulifera solaris]